MKTYKYYVHGKPKTFDLTSLTPEEMEKFKNMSNTERLKFIELHHLENIPLWEQIDLKTSTKLSDEGEADRKNKQKYSDLFRAKNIKNHLDQMKTVGKKELTDEDLKKLNDFEYQDVKQNIDKGYTDIDSLINYYANKIETLNVDSIDTLKAKEIQNLEAKNISKISVGLEGLKSIAETYKTIQEELKKYSKSEDKKSIANSIISDKDFIKELADKTAKALNVSVSKEDLSQILSDSGLINEIIKEVKDKIKTIETITKTNDEDIKRAIKTALTEYTKKQLTAEDVKNIIKENVKSLNEEKINQFLQDTGAIKAVMDELKSTTDDITERQKDINEAISDLKISTQDAKEAIDLIKDYQKGLITKDELKEMIAEISKGKLSPEQINAIVNTDKSIKELETQLRNINQSLTTLTDFKEIIATLNKQGLNFYEIFNELFNVINDIIDDYGFDNRKGVNTKIQDYLNYTDPAKTPIAWPKSGEADNVIRTKILHIIHNSAYLPEYKGSSTMDVKAKKYKQILTYLNNVFKKFDEYNNYFNTQSLPQQGQGFDEDEGGKFLNRFKDYEPDIKRLEGMIKEIKNELKDLKDMKIKINAEQRKEPETQKNDKPLPAPFLNDISKPKNLKPTETKIYEPEEEHKYLKDILRKRREDIEPDEYEEEDVDWGEGITNRVIKFKALMKYLN